MFEKLKNKALIKSRKEEKTMLKYLLLVILLLAFLGNPFAVVFVAFAIIFIIIPISMLSIVGGMILVTICILEDLSDTWFFISRNVNRNITKVFCKKG